MPKDVYSLLILRMNFTSCTFCLSELELRLCNIFFLYTTVLRVVTSIYLEKMPFEKLYYVSYYFACLFEVVFVSIAFAKKNVPFHCSYIHLQHVYLFFLIIKVRFFIYDKIIFKNITCVFCVFLFYDYDMLGLNIDI